MHIFNVCGCIHIHTYIYVFYIYMIHTYKYVNYIYVNDIHMKYTDNQASEVLRER